MILYYNYFPFQVAQISSFFLEYKNDELHYFPESAIPDNFTHHLSLFLLQNNTKSHPNTHIFISF